MNKHSSKRLTRRQIAAAIVARSRENVVHHHGYVTSVVMIDFVPDGVATKAINHGVGEELEAEAFRDGVKMAAEMSTIPTELWTQWHPHAEGEPECTCAVDRIDDRTIWRNAAAEAALI